MTFMDPTAHAAILPRRDGIRRPAASQLTTFLSYAAWAGSFGFTLAIVIGLVR